jgi:ABC-2 type transport system ATP-binding protein
MPANVIEIKGLTKRFASVVAVNKVDLRIKKGEFHGLLGRNGAGKTTLLNLLTGQLKPDSGTAKVLGISPFKEPITVKKRIGIVPEIESPPSFLTGLEYLQYIGLVRNIEDIEKRAEHWIDYFDLAEFQNVLCKNMSKGTKQRFVLAAAFIHEPEVLFIDEPFLGLDPYHQKLLTDHLTKFRSKGGTIFMCTHILEMAEKLCTHISIMKRGSVVATGTLDQIRRGKETLNQTFLRLTRQDGQKVRETVDEK